MNGGGGGKSTKAPAGAESVKGHAPRRRKREFFRNY